MTATLETPAVANPCYNLLWIEDRTIPDGTQMKAQRSIHQNMVRAKQRRMRLGAWLHLQPIWGDPMEGEPLVLTEPIPAGAKRELSIELVVPSGQNGLIQSSWRMTDENGIFFGDTLSVNIVVGTVTTPTATKAP